MSSVLMWLDDSLRVHFMDVFSLFMCTQFRVVRSIANPG